MHFFMLCSTTEMFPGQSRVPRMNNQKGGYGSTVKGVREKITTNKEEKKTKEEDNDDDDGQKEEKKEAETITEGEMAK